MKPLAFAIVAVCACTRAPSATPEELAAAKGQPSVVEVQHVLIGFKSSSLQDKATRNFAAAIRLARRVHRLANKGDDFDALVKQYTDDEYPGVFRVTNYGVATSGDQVNRKSLVSAFGDTGFALKVGEVGATDFDLKASPSGFHIIKRLK